MYMKHAEYAQVLYKNILLHLPFYGHAHSIVQYTPHASFMRNSQREKNKKWTKNEQKINGNKKLSTKSVDILAFSRELNECMWMCVSNKSV